MSTFKDLQDRIALDYLNNMTLVSEVKRAIVNTIKRYECERYWFNEASTAVATVANQTYLSVPTDFMALDGLEITYSGCSQYLIELEFDKLRQMNAIANTGQPTHYAYRGDRFELAAIPDAIYPVTIYYIKTLPTLDLESDSNAWTNEAQNVIAHAATIELMMGVLKTATKQQIEYHSMLLRQAENELSYRNSLRLTTRLQATTF
jgi:hypothetical protein